MIQHETPFTILEDKEILETLNEGIRSLDRREQFAIEAKFFEGMTYEEIGSCLLSRNSCRCLEKERARQITNIACNKLRKFIQKFYGE